MSACIWVCGVGVCLFCAGACLVFCSPLIFFSFCLPSVGLWHKNAHTLALSHPQDTQHTHTHTHSHLRIHIHSATDCACVHFWFTPTYPTHCTLDPRTLNTAHYTHIPYTLHPHTLYTVHYTHIPYTLHTTPKHSYTQTPRAQIVTKHHAGEPTRGF
jgi:hypothetical protein